MTMAKKEADFDRFIDRKLNDVNITAYAQGSLNAEIDNALKSASKNQKGNVGFPDFVAIVNGFVLVLETKSDVEFLADYEDTATGRKLVMGPHATENYALNAALFYANHIVKNTSFKKVFAFGCAGNETHYTIKPLFVGEHISTDLPGVLTFANFSENNIEAYHNCSVRGEKTSGEMQLDAILKKAKQLHEYLRNYGNLGENEKSLVVSAILLALRELKRRSLRLDQLTGNIMPTDGDVLFGHLENSLKIANIGCDMKLRQVLDQYSVFFAKLRSFLFKCIVRSYCDQVYHMI
jgi:hypothetical protein